MGLSAVLSVVALAETEALAKVDELGVGEWWVREWVGEGMGELASCPHQPLTTSNQQPETRNQKPATSSPKLETRNQKPATSSPKLETRN